MNEQEAKRLCALRELVRETFAQTLMIDTDAISDTADFFDELGGDSLDSLDVAVHLEEICGQRVPEEEYALCPLVWGGECPLAACFSVLRPVETAEGWYALLTLRDGQPLPPQRDSFRTESGV